MRVKIGPYVDRWTSTVHDRYMIDKYGYNNWPETQTRFENFLEKTEDVLQWIYNHTINLYLDRKERRVKIRIDNYDTWSMDDTLALIVLPMLKQLKATTHGAPAVSLQDVPESLWPVGEKGMSKPYQGETDENYFKRWDYVLDEMIYAFECKANKDEPYMRIDDIEEAQKEQERISNGFRLFGKYYEGLWD